MKQYRIRFYARMSVVATLGAVGLVALSGEPAEGTNFIAVVCGQIGVAAACWGTAWWLAKRWRLTRVLLEQGARIKDRNVSTDMADKTRNKE